MIIFLTIALIILFIIVAHNEKAMNKNADAMKLFADQTYIRLSSLENDVLSLKQKIDKLKDK